MEGDFYDAKVYSRRDGLLNDSHYYRVAKMHRMLEFAGLFPQKSQ